MSALVARRIAIANANMQALRTPTASSSPFPRVLLPIRPYSSTTSRLASHEVPKGNGNPGSDLGYSPRQIWRRASPRVRFWIVVGLGFATVAESAFWVQFAPKVFRGKGVGEEK